MSSIKVGLACLALLTLAGPAPAEIVFVSDYSGNVGRWDTATGTGLGLGNLSSVAPPGGVNPVGVVGLAYDPLADRLILLDREAQHIYAMDAQTGEASFLFQATFSHPSLPDPVPAYVTGGAVVDGLLYAVVGSEHQFGNGIAAFSLVDGTWQHGVANLPGPIHSVGINPVTGNLYTHVWEGDIFEVFTDGTPPTSILTPSLSQIFSDIDYLHGDFVAVDYIGFIIDGAPTLAVHIDGTTGEVTSFLTQEQLESMGLVNAAAIAVAYPVPEPTSLGLMLVGSGSAGLAWAARRRRKRTA